MTVGPKSGVSVYARYAIPATSTWTRRATAARRGSRSGPRSTAAPRGRAERGIRARPLAASRSRGARALAPPRRRARIARVSAAIGAPWSGPRSPTGAAPARRNVGAGRAGRNLPGASIPNGTLAHARFSARNPPESWEWRDRHGEATESTHPWELLGSRAFAVARRPRRGRRSRSLAANSRAPVHGEPSVVEWRTKETSARARHRRWRSRRHSRTRDPSDERRKLCELARRPRRNWRSRP